LGLPQYGRRLNEAPAKALGRIDSNVHAGVQALAAAGSATRSRTEGVSLMCGRYAAFLPAEAIARLFHTANPVPSVAPSWNVAPTQQALVVRRHPGTGERHLDLLNWGLLPHFTQDPVHARRPINARAEGVASSGLFRSAFARRRCLVPADAFFEWKVVDGGKQPYAIARQDGQPMAFAGLWEGFRSPDAAVLRTFTIITTSANTTLAALHDRMPAVIEPADWPVWLGEAEGELAALLRPAEENVLKVWPVSRDVNAPRNNGPALLAPLGEAA
jgi:putative SOS response-associated peptidase YedK